MNEYSWGLTECACLDSFLTVCQAIYDPSKMLISGKFDCCCYFHLISGFLLMQVKGNNPKVELRTPQCMGFLQAWRLPVPAISCITRDKYLNQVCCHPLWLLRMQEKCEFFSRQQIVAVRISKFEPSFVFQNYFLQLIQDWAGQTFKMIVTS